MKFLVIVEANFSASVSEAMITVVLSGLDRRFLLGDVLLLDLKGFEHNYKIIIKLCKAAARA